MELTILKRRVIEDVEFIDVKIWLYLVETSDYRWNVVRTVVTGG